MKRGKRGTISLSFTAIFSVLLIIIFIVTAGIVINMFLKFSCKASIGMEAKDFREEIYALKVKSGPKHQVTYTLEFPKKVKYVCFINGTDRKKINSYRNNEKEYLMAEETWKRYNWENGIFKSKQAIMIVYPEDACGIPSAWFSLKCGDKQDKDCLDVSKLTEDTNPYCVKNNDGKIEVKLKKDVGWYNGFVYLEIPR